MKKLFRSLTGILTAVFLVSCASPYQAQMHAVYNARMTGNMSEEEYRHRMNDLAVADAGWQQQQANAATAAAIVGFAALGIAAANDCHYGHWHGGYCH